MRRYSRIAALYVAAAVLAGCSGVQGPGPLPLDSASQRAKDGGTGRARAELYVKVPKKDPRRRYVSPSTKSLKISEGAIALGTFDTTASSKGCSAVGGATLCTFRVGVVPQKNATFAVQAYDALDGGGNLLSTGKAVQTIVAGANVIRLTLGGVVSSIAVTVVNPNPLAGIAASGNLIVTAQDADHNDIVGPGDYANTSGAPSPIALTDTDKSGATSFTIDGTAGTVVDAPTDVVKLVYTGGSVGLATIGATASNVPAANVTPGTFVPRPAVLQDIEMPFGQAFASLDPTAIATGPDGNLYVAVAGGAANDGIVKIVPAAYYPDLTYFVNGTYPSTSLPAVRLNGLTLGPGPAIWYAGGTSIGSMTTAGVATNYQLATAAGICTNDMAARIVPSANGGVWFTILCNSGSQIGYATATGAITVFTLAGLTDASGIIVGSDGDLYVVGQDANNGLAAIAQIPVTGSTAGTPVILDGPANAGLLYGIAQDAAGDLWATGAGNPCGSAQLVRVHIASPFTASNVQGFNTLTSCSTPAFIKALPDGSLWIPEDGYPVVERAIPGVFPAAPSLFDLALPTPFGVTGAEWDAAVGGDGNLYIVDHSDSSSNSGDVVQVAY